MKAPKITMTAAELKRLRMIPPCARCGAGRCTTEENPVIYPVCGWCAAKEVALDETWKWQRTSHDNDLWAAAKRFVEANSDSDLLEQLGIDRDQLKELKARVGRKRMAA